MILGGLAAAIVVGALLRLSFLRWSRAIEKPLSESWRDEQLRREPKVRP